MLGSHVLLSWVDLGGLYGVVVLDSLYGCAGATDAPGRGNSIIARWGVLWKKYSRDFEVKNIMHARVVVERWWSGWVFLTAKRRNGRVS